MQVQRHTSIRTFAAGRWIAAVASGQESDRTLDAPHFPEGTSFPQTGVRDAPEQDARVDLERFIERVRDAAAHDDPQAIGQAIAGFRPSWRSVGDWVRVRSGRYTRTLAYRDENVEVLVLTWARGAKTPVHDHAGQRCWMLVVHGALEVCDFRAVVGGRRPGPAYLEPLGDKRILRTGEVDARPGLSEIHAVGTAPEQELAVSVHVYAKPVDRCLVFDRRRGRCEERRLRYDFIGPRTRKEPTLAAVAVKAVEPDSLYGRLSRWWRRAKETGEDLLVPSHVTREQAQVQMTNVRHHYGDVEALRDVTLNVRSGDFMVLLGPSGCGKSTLLHALAGHVKPSGGVLCIDGRPVVGPGPDRMMMFQESALFPWMSVEQNITFVLAALKVPRAERRARAREFIKLVQLEGFEHTLPHQLSGGMKMRAALARALAVNPPVLLMDEPFGSLDAQTRLRMHELLQRLWAEQQKTVVFVTHDVHEALMLATRVVVMARRPGRVIADLEVKLPPGRDPDGAELAELSGRIRALMRENEEGESDAFRANPAPGGIPGGAGGRLGGGLGAGTVAVPPVPRTRRGH